MISSITITSLSGLSTDIKPTWESLNTGSTFLELDTFDVYVYDRDTKVWTLKESGGGTEVLKTINGQDLHGEGNIAITTYQAFGASWPTTGSYTTKQFCDVLDADETVTIGMGYFGGASWLDRPGASSGLVNGDVVVEITEGPSSTKSIHLIMTSSSIYPYRWEYTYWSHGSVSGWRGVQPELTTGTVNTGTIENAIGFNSSGNLIKGTISSGASEIDLNDATYTSSETYYTLDKSYDNEIPTIINPNLMDYKENYPNAIYVTLLDGYGKFYAASVTKDSVGSPTVYFNGYLLINKFIHKINITISLDLQNQEFSINSIDGGENVYNHIGQLAQDLTFPIVELIPCRHISKEENSSYVVSNLLDEYFTNFDFAGMYAVYMRVPEVHHESE